MNIKRSQLKKNSVRIMENFEKVVGYILKKL